MLYTLNIFNFYLKNVLIIVLAFNFCHLKNIINFSKGKDKHVLYIDTRWQPKVTICICFSKLCYLSLKLNLFFKRGWG